MSSVNQIVIKHMVSLLNLAAKFGKVSRVCKAVRLPRNTSYRYQATVKDSTVTLRWKT